MRSVLIIEDNPTMVRALEDNFSYKGFSVTVARDGKAGLDAALNCKADLIILDIMLPQVNGFEICSAVRNKGFKTPIIMLTAKGAEEDIIMGLNLGADDYVTKPFSIKELLARAEALLRRSGQSEAEEQRFGDFTLDNKARKLTRQGKEVNLSPKELKVLQLLVKRRGCVLTRDEILSSALGSTHFISAADIDNLIKEIRRKIEPDLQKPTFVHTIGGVGYKFEPV
jgi:two-component system alkaline phosphatase synthesis response regulator PhoP